MNDKEKELWRVIDNVIRCCAITNPDGTLNITREEVLGKSRTENLVMARCMVVEQMLHAGFSTTTTATGFEMMVNNVTLPLLASNGEALTALTAGLHIVVFDKQNNRLQLIV